jgi:hypothetical protein
MEKCLLDVNLALQKEIDQHFGRIAVDDPTQKEKRDAVNDSSRVQSAVQSTAVFDEDDPDGMMAAFFAQQKAATEKAEKLPIGDWAPHFAAALRDKKTNNHETTTASNRNLCSSEMDLVDRLWNKFSSLQES